MNCNNQTTYYIFYDELTVMMVTDVDEMCEYLADEAILYGYAYNEDMARTLMAECMSRISVG
ncbi:hypothetical protein [Paenibacillus thalictri]|uniref:Uncharacterized protein n=1 Tax=Paenibacillus thalictri TaxID=2527873 RepID=A0A4Q9DFL3_9BACL|nr:hypothetical protein [Paenibacillus thalictri]TBL67630.1 hypothetical protein EYB31_39500 [Paenibacillus thalictri]